MYKSANRPRSLQKCRAKAVLFLEHEILDHLFHYLAAIATFGQVSLHRGQNPIEPNEDDVVNNERPNISVATAHEIRIKI